MKNNYAICLCLLLFCFPLLLNAQTISADAIPSVGQSITLFSISPSEVEINQGSSGDQVDWDFSFLPEDQQQTASFLNPVNTPHGSEFPDASLAIGYSDSLQLGTIPVKYEYYDNNADGFVKHGEANIRGVTIPLTNPTTVLKFPMEYQSSYSDDFSGSYSVNDIDITRTGSVNVYADGRGSLNLPYGTIEDVIRVKTTTNYEDDIPSQNINFKIEIETYAWYHPNYAYPLMYIIFERSEGVSTLVANMSYMISDAVPFLPVGVERDPLSLVSVSSYPNPTTDFVQLEYGLPSNAAVNIQVYNSVGQSVQTILNEEQGTGAYKQSIDMRSYPKGLYYIELLMNEHRKVQSIVVH